MQAPIISFNDFSFQYRAQKQPTLRHINLDIYPGERVLIAGPSGSGKSTLGSCLNGLVPLFLIGRFDKRPRRLSFFAKLVDEGNLRDPRGLLMVRVSNRSFERDVQNLPAAAHLHLAFCQAICRDALAVWPGQHTPRRGLLRFYQHISFGI